MTKHSPIALWCRLALCCVLLSLAARAQAMPLRFYVHELPPLVFVNGSGTSGYLIETLDALMRTVGQQHPTEVVPFQRGLLLTQKSSNAAFSVVARTPQRESHFRWVGPLLISRVFLYKKAGGRVDAKDIRSVKHYRVAVVQGDAVHDVLKKQQFNKIALVPSQADAFRMLISGAVDLVPAGEDFVQDGPTKQLPGALVEKTPLQLEERQLFIAFSRRVPEPEVQRWQAALDKLHRSGELDTIAAKYLGADRRLR